METTNVSIRGRRGRRGLFAAGIAFALVFSLAQSASASSAKKLAFGVGPSTTVAGQIVAPAVTVWVLDQQNRLVTDSTAPVALTLGGGGTLYGTTTGNAVGGVATFSTLRVLPAGSYTLSASSPGLLSATSSSFSITGAGASCNANGCTVSDPNGSTPTNQNGTTGTVQIPNCPGAGTNTDFLSYDESAGDFCPGGCLGAAVFFASDCDSGDPWLITYRLDKSELPLDKGAPHIVMYIQSPDNTVTAIPDCVKAGVLAPYTVCVSRQFKSGQGDAITEILKAPGDPRIAG
jgi:hypothetical protein